jgi:hypothetical protein
LINLSRAVAVSLLLSDDRERLGLLAQVVQEELGGIDYEVRLTVGYRAMATSILINC